MNQILIANASNPILDRDIINKMFRFRHKVFYEPGVGGRE